MNGFRGLDVYRRSTVLADAIAAAVPAWPRLHRWSAGLQLLKAADSVGANIAEACGRDTRPDRRRQLYVARGSAFELEHWLERAVARGLDLPPGALQEAQEISRMLNGLTRRWSLTLTTDD